MTNPPNGFEPHFSYSFKSFVPGWQASSSGAAGASAGASAAGAAAGAGGGGFHPPNAHYHNYYGGRYYRPRRFGFARRFVWFGLGAMAATWWINHKMNKDERRKLWHQEMHDRQAAMNNARAFPEAAPPYKFDWTSHRPAFPCSERAPATPPEQATPAVAIPTEFPKPAAVAPAPVPEPVVVAPVVAAPAPAAQAPVAEERSRRSWGWRARRREQAEREKAERDAAAAAAAAATPAVVPEDEMARIRESVERLWEERVREGREAQARAEDAAREYARDKLDRLSSTLDRLRETLAEQPKSGSDGKPRDGRMV